MGTERPLTLSASAVHDLKNQLGIILGFIDLLIEDTPESEPQRADLLEIRNAARACHDIVIASSGDTPR
jgi:signal transduction histidine kinase